LEVGKGVPAEKSVVAGPEAAEVAQAAGDRGERDVGGDSDDVAIAVTRNAPRRLRCHHAADGGRGDGEGGGRTEGMGG